MEILAKFCAYKMDAVQELWVQISAEVDEDVDNERLGSEFVHLNSMDGFIALFSVGQVGLECKSLMRCQPMGSGISKNSKRSLSS